MKRIRYLSLILMLLCGITVSAQEDFNPTSPSEPGQMATKLTIVADPADGGTVSNGGKYTPGTQVSLSASAKTGFKFVNWTNAKGDVVSETSSFKFTKGDVNESLIAHFKFVPTDPNEPEDISANMRYWLILIAEEGGSVSGEGRYKTGTSVSVSANTSSSLYQFIGWYDVNGELVSTDASFKYTMKPQTVTLTARYKYVPDAPAEPDELKGIHTLKLTAEEGGSVYASPEKYRLQEGESVRIYANTNSGYEFTGWYLNGELYKSDSNFDYTMGNANVEFEARFRYVPDSPNEPTPAAERTFSFTLYNVNCKPGDNIEYPIWLTTQETLKDMTFQLTFDNRLSPDLDNVVLSDKATGYTVSRQTGEAPEGYNSYIYTLSGGTMEAGNTALLNFNIPIPSTMETGLYYPVTINQISMTNAEGITQTAGTRNGRVSVYKNGDSNGDNEVDIFDVTNVVSNVLGKDTKIFIQEVSDVNADNEIDIFDVTGIVKIVLNE